MNNAPMLNAYPDSIGGTLADIVSVLQKPELKDTLSGFYILPSLFHSDLDRGFCVVDYNLEETLATQKDLSALKELGISLKLDFVLNHLSAQSPQFLDLLKRGEESPYKDFFINWNQFWAGYGEMTEEGYIQPDEQYIKDMFFRKPGLPILMVEFADGKKVPYWNTFYQQVNETDHGKEYLGQMDLNIRNEGVINFYQETLHKLASYGAELVRLDAFAYAPKGPGKKNFMNEPDTWDFLEEIHKMAQQENLDLLPEIHASYGEKVYQKIADQGYLVYDFFLPGLLIDAIEHRDATTLLDWANEIVESGMRTVNMLGCHDGIPLLDLKGLVPEERIQSLIDLVVSRGGYVKDLHGAKNVYYQVNATYFSALGEDEKKMLLARAIQLFMPGKPQIWYLDLFQGENDLEAVRKAGPGGHKEINRTNLSLEEVDARLTKESVQKQLDLLRFRNTSPAFDWDAQFVSAFEDGKLVMQWMKGENTAQLTADLNSYDFLVMGTDKEGNLFTLTN